MPMLGGGNFNMGNGGGDFSPFFGRRFGHDFRRMGFGPQWEGQQQFMSGLAGSDIFSFLPQRAQNFVTNWNTAHPMTMPAAAGTPDATGTSPATPGTPTPTTPAGPNPMGGGMGGNHMGMGLRGGRGK